jgi:6-phosphogluconolactonase
MDEQTVVPTFRAARFRAWIGLAAAAAILLPTCLPRLAAADDAGAATQAPAAQTQGTPRAMRVYVGTYTGPKSKGIYQMRLDLAQGSLGTAEVAGETPNPSFLAVHPSRRFLYATNEVWGPPAAASVTALAIAPDTGRLTFLNKQSSGGAGPCHISIDKEGRCALVANYGGGSVCSLPIDGAGRLGEPTAIVQHKGSGPNPKRQEGPHAHSIYPDPPGRFALAADLGLDKVLVYRLDAARGSLLPNDPPGASVAPGAGPRHLAFHPGGRFAYVISEMASTVTAFGYDGERGTLKPLQTVSTLPADYRGESTTAEIEVHPSGRFLYGSNRGHDSIAIFAIEPQTGLLKPLGHQPTQGKTPRNFAIEPTGAWLLAANQGSDSVVVFRIDPATGGLSPSGAAAGVPSPVCVVFVPMP